MIVRISLLASFLAVSTLAFECSPDTILRMATNKREKQLERECHEQKTAQPVCATKDTLEKSWKEFQEVSEQYKTAVAECRKYVDEKSRPKRTNEKTSRSREGHGHADGKHQQNEDHRKHGEGHAHGRKRREHDPSDPNVDHTGHNHRMRRSDNDDPNDTTIDHTGHNHRMRRHDPNDPNIDHTGHNHRRKRSNDDPNDTTIDHTGHNHRMRRSGDHDPNDPNVDHTGHNHRMRRSHNDDPNDTTIDHTGHNHRMRRHDPNDPNIDHTGHNHRRRRSGDHDPNDPNVDHTGHNHRRRRHHDIASRSRRTVCATAGHDQLSAMSSKFSKHCERGNICLPDEDLPKGKQQDDILALQKLRAKKYSDYLSQLSLCYGKL
ncbi:unnamed protein product [Caenorhabditis sp. 36 PRJEB53466]|nr:unnamed protein product [Caenorhabditis sp. 36 PRJEB53466]